MLAAAALTATATTCGDDDPARQPAPPTDVRKGQIADLKGLDLDRVRFQGNVAKPPLLATAVSVNRSQSKRPHEAPHPFHRALAIATVAAIAALASAHGAAAEPPAPTVPQYIAVPDSNRGLAHQHGANRLPPAPIEAPH